MSTIAPTTCQYIYDYYAIARPHLESDPVLITPIRRLWIAAKADAIGEIPVIGTVVGIVRIIFGLLAAGVFKIGEKCAQRSGDMTLKERRILNANLAMDEFTRGLFELFPCCLISWADNTYRENETQNTPHLLQSAEARGNFIYVTPKGHFYAKEWHSNVKLCLSERPPAALAQPPHS
ncbi:MAG: hypothetical protein KGJ02_02710 [Verrucomicrobiota bacterium]|nr:hypothetical protein [Verrucomicrobiota bacterium]